MDKMNKLRKVARTLREQAETLSSLGMKSEHSKLMEIASDCDDEADQTDPESESHFAFDGGEEPSYFRPHGPDTGIITRGGGGCGDAELRTLVSNLYITNTTLFKKRLDGTIATVTNVVLNRQDMTAAKIREMIRPPRNGRSKR
jgi:hypothetical protein